MRGGDEGCCSQWPGERSRGIDPCWQKARSEESVRVREAESESVEVFECILTHISHMTAYCRTNEV